MEEPPIDRFVFPRWTEHLRPVVLIGCVLAPAYVVLVMTYAASPRTLDVGYQPEQPIAFSHAVHAGDLELDCRYCHNVEESAHAALPTTETCYTCHHVLKAYTDKFKPVMDSYATGTSIEWVRVHDLPDHVRFDHRIHIHRGVACATCHGKVYEMDVVRQVETLSMGWCLDCHRNPERYVQPLESLPERDWDPGEDRLAIGRYVVEQLGIRPSTDCSSCHR